MKIIRIALISLMTIGFFQQAQARDTRHMFSLSEAMSTAAAEEKLNQGIKFYFGDQKHATIKQNHGEFKTSKKTNAFGKSDKQACEWVFLSALLQLQKKAVDLGGDAVINIKSNYKHNEVSSATEYECGAGAILAGVALKGTVVNLK